MSQAPPSQILIVDDNEEYRYVIEFTLQALGHTCVTASDGKEALEYLATKTPDLVLMDINMPNMDGLTALKNIRANQKFRSVPVIMISTIEENEIVLKCLEEGADDYINKPFEKTILRARVVNNLIRRSFYKKEKELLEKTLLGSVHVLSDILETLDPKIFTKISRLKRHCKFINAELSTKVDNWVLDMSVHYSLIGCIYQPRDFVLKAVQGRMLHSEEKKLFELHTQHGFKLLSKIPRLESVAENIRFMFKNIDGTGTPEEYKMRGDGIPLGSRILRAAWEYDFLYLKDEKPEAILSSIKALSDRVDSEMLYIVEQLFYSEKTGEVIEIKAEQLVPGMIFAEDIYTKKKVKVAGMWQEVTDTVFDRIVSISTTFGIREPFKVIKPQKLNK
ncbi:MAG: response regulator [Leptospiraceae bacterium]|nr:response regulator [Leptospiraceae bacterium]